MQLIRITSETCPACIVMKEVMRRVMPEYPDIEIVDYDLDLDEEEAMKWNPKREVPFIQLGSSQKTGSCTMDELRAFLKETLQKKVTD